MRVPGSFRGLHHALAFSALIGLSGGCIAIYSFDDFDKQPPVSCKVDADCTGSDACGKPTCDKGLCTLTNLAAAGALSRNHVIGDCYRVFCDGKGNELKEVDSTNVRSDGIACTQDVCIDNKPENIVAMLGTPCGVPGTEATLQCNGMGVCQGCVAATDCGIKTACADWACEDGACVKKLQPVGTEVENPAPGDCRKNLCNGAGESPDTFSANDAPDDNDPCTLDYCTTNYEFQHDKLSPGTQCGDCKVCNEQGTCNPCDAMTSDCYNGTCVPKPQTCMADSECASTYCVDGFCCNSECSATCMGCSQAKTGALSGVCAPIINGTDPDDECPMPTDDFCVDRECGCHNGIKDGMETGTDCGGVCSMGCSGTWDCGATSACTGLNASRVCCSEFDCAACVDQSASCATIDGSSCTLGASKQIFTIGTVSDFGCPWYAGFTACRTVTCLCK